MSDLHAVDALSEAYGATREFLFPFTLRRWAVLGVVVFFISGAGGFSPPTGFPGGSTSDIEVDGPGGIEAGPIESISLDSTTVVLLAAAVLGLLILALVFSVVGAILEFVFVRQLTQRDVRIRGYFGASIGRGLRLFGFRLGLGLLLVIGLIGLVSLFVLVPFAFLGPVAILGLLFLVPVALVGVAFAWVAYRFTADFVVPIMLVDDVNVLPAWGILWGEMKAARKQYTVYAVARFLLDIVVWIAFAFGFVLLVLVVAIPFLIVGAVGFLALSGTVGSTVGAVLLGGYLLLYGLAFLVTVTLLLGVPLGTFLRYYSLIVLAETSPAYDMLADVRGTAGPDGERPEPRG